MIIVVASLPSLAFVPYYCLRRAHYSSKITLLSTSRPDKRAGLVPVLVPVLYLWLGCGVAANLIDPVGLGISYIDEQAGSSANDT